MRSNFSHLRPVVAAACLLALALPARAADLQTRILSAQEKVLPALVHVQPISEVYTGGQKRTETGVGSGVIIDRDGTIVTNYHVVGKGATRIFCTLANKERLEAELIGGDPYTDIAVIRLNDPDFEPPIDYARLGDSDRLEAGEFVIALGSPLSLSRSISHGIISSLDRYLGGGDKLPSGELTGNFNTWIQTDAAINFGNSGGPLVNLEGRVIGINSRRGSVFSDNLGFAIPVNVVKEVVGQILETGEVVRSTIGIDLQPLQELEDFFGISAETGALVAGVVPGSPASAAGIQQGDIILSFNGQETSARFAEQIPAIYRMIADTPVNETVPVTVFRRTGEVTLEVITDKLGESVGEDFEAGAWGFTVRGITEQDARQRRLPDTTGVLVSSKSMEAQTGLRTLSGGDVIVSVNDVAIADLEDFREVYGNMVEGGVENILLKVRRAAMIRWVALQPLKGGAQ